MTMTLRPVLVHLFSHHRLCSCRFVFTVVMFDVNFFHCFLPYWSFSSAVIEATSFLTVAESSAMKDMIFAMQSLNSSCLDLSLARDWTGSNNSKLRIKILGSFSP